jgi:hypothetical protein
MENEPEALARSFTVAKDPDSLWLSHELCVVQWPGAQGQAGAQQSARSAGRQHHRRWAQPDIIKHEKSTKRTSSLCNFMMESFRRLHEKLALKAGRSAAPEKV